jgi:hypothetical protein
MLSMKSRFRRNAVSTLRLVFARELNSSIRLHYFRLSRLHCSRGQGLDKPKRGAQPLRALIAATTEAIVLSCIYHSLRLDMTNDYFFVELFPSSSFVVRNQARLHLLQLEGKEGSCSSRQMQEIKLAVNTYSSI